MILGENHLPARIIECISEYLFFVSNPKKYTHKQKAKGTKKNRRKKMLLLWWTISVGNLMRYDGIVWEFALCSSMLKAVNCFYIYIYILCSRWKPKQVNAIKTSLSTYFIQPSFPNFNIKMIEFCTLQKRYEWTLFSFRTTKDLSIKKSAVRAVL